MSSKPKILFVIPPTFEDIYGGSFIKSAVSPAYMVLSYPVIAASLRENKYQIKAIDLNTVSSPKSYYERVLKEFSPDFLAFSITTPTFKKVNEYCRIAKLLLPGAFFVAGGPHVSVLPEETLRNGCFDIVVIGEGDLNFKKIIDKEKFKDIPGVAYLDNDDFCINQSTFVKDLDSLPMPFMDIYDSSLYYHPKISSRRNPVASMETSRGCFGRCVFCNKSVFGAKIRFKSKERVIDEMKYILSLGYKEIHLIDDLFTANLSRAKEICELIINEHLNLSWMIRGGVRVDTIDQELFYLLKRSGNWRVAFGIESGSQQILNNANKGINLYQVAKAINMARKAGLETEGYFMLGLPGETQNTLKETIKFSKSLRLDYAKFAVTVPLPGTILFEEWNKTGLIKTKDWSKYTFSSKPSDLYDHPTVSWKILDRFYRKCHKSFYFSSSYILRRIFKSIFSGMILDDLKMMFKIKWF